MILHTVSVVWVSWGTVGLTMTCYLALFVDYIPRMKGAVKIGVDDGVEVIGEVYVFLWGITGLDCFYCCESIVRQKNAYGG